LNTLAYALPVKYGQRVIYFQGSQVMGWDSRYMEEGYTVAANAGGGKIAPLAQRYTLRVRYSPSVSDMRLRRAICARDDFLALSQ